MKNIKQLLVATVALLSVGSMASLMQPHVPTSEDAPIRVSAGLMGGLVKPETGFGVNNMGLGIGFTHNVGYDFEYGLAVSGNWASAFDARLFTDDVKDKKISGVALDVELLARFMPQIADAFRVGGYLNVGYSNLFGGEDLKGYKEAISFGDLGLRVGLAASFGFSDMVSMYFAPAYSLTAIRFANSDKVKTDAEKKAFKEMSNLSGMELPLGVWFGVADNVGLFLEANTRFRDFSNFTKSWKEDITLGVSFAI